jgi:hypothetical protein
MNQGLYGFPNPRSGNLIEIKNFESSGTYSIPSGARYITMLVVGGGAGGGSGSRQAAGVNSFGGGTGSGGQVFYDTLCVDGYVQFGGSLIVLIGAGGDGGVSQTTNSSNGNDGSNGSATYVSFSNFQSITRFLAYAAGGDRGRGGTTTGGVGGAGRTATLNKVTAVNGVASPGTTSFGGGYTFDRFAGNYGASGSGVDSGNSQASTGAPILHGSPTNAYTGFFNPAFVAYGGTLVGGGDSTNGFNGENGNARGFVIGGDSFMHGVGGGGGCGRSAAVAGNGGNGYRGGGGGGGGGSRNGFNSGAGGRGGNGYVCFWVWG